LIKKRMTAARQLLFLLRTALFQRLASLPRFGRHPSGSKPVRGAVHLFIEALFSVAEWLRIHFLSRSNLLDEADNHLIELAVIGSVEVVVSTNKRDQNFGALLFPGLKVLMAGSFSSNSMFDSKMPSRFSTISTLWTRRAHRPSLRAKRSNPARPGRAHRRLRAWLWIASLRSQ
jgi:hypothetical protein